MSSSIVFHSTDWLDSKPDLSSNDSYPIHPAAPVAATNKREIGKKVSDDPLCSSPVSPSFDEAPEDDSSFIQVKKRAYTTPYQPLTPETTPEPQRLRLNQSQIEQDQPDSAFMKRHSTVSIPDDDSMTDTHCSSMTVLGRHHTTGHGIKSARQRKAENERMNLIRRAEEFQKELSGRRKAFRRLSKLNERKHSNTDDKVLMGTRISEGHQNYVLMYNMLTGIRIAVSRVEAKIDRPVTPEDFTASHKLVFDVAGDELTPGTRYDFKFKDYAPWVFRHIRKNFGIDPADYLISLTSKYILSELGSPGKSGSFFYYSRDYRFIIKTIHHTEHKFMRNILKEYHQHVSENPSTLLCRYYGLHRVKLPYGRKIHFVVMSNVFPPNKDIHETYDLKGSTLGRFLPEEQIKKNPYAVMKDLNWEKNKRKLRLGPSKRKLFMGQLLRDVTLLSQLNIMDYSLLIGVHDMLRGNKENVRDATLSTFQPDTKAVERRNTLMKRRKSKAQVIRRAIAEANPNKLDASKLPEDLQERRNCVFYTDEGGFRGTDDHDRPVPVLYSLGIIDILTPYDIKKKSEHVYKSLTTHDKNAISAVKPSQYGQRFLEFMARAVLENNHEIPSEYKLHNRSRHFFKLHKN